jgi:hypothetical protein
MWDKMMSRTSSYVVTPKNLNIQSNMTRKLENENTIRTLQPDQQPEKSLRSESVTGCRRRTKESVISVYSVYGETGQSQMKDIINHTAFPTDTKTVKRPPVHKNDESVERINYYKSPSRVRKL